MQSDQGKNFELLFPENSSEIILTLAKKYGLLTEFLESSPRKVDEKDIIAGFNIAEIIKEIAEEKTTPENLSSLLSERLKLSQEVAKKLASDLEKEVLIFVQKVPIEEKKGEVNKEEKEILSGDEKTIRPLTEEIEETEKIEEKVPHISPKKFPKETGKKDSEPDVYRESIE